VREQFSDLLAFERNELVVSVMLEELRTEIESMNTRVVSLQNELIAPA
jgi:hypothetical protein